jgi:hypothetical protein
MPRPFGDLSTNARTLRNLLMKKPSNHRFTLILAGVAELSADLADLLYEATGGDIELQMRDGIATVEFERNGRSLHQAVTAAIREVEAAGVGARVVRVESESANVIAKINAELLGNGMMVGKQEAGD